MQNSSILSNDPYQILRSSLVLNTWEQE
jgi:hypothetical protein